MHVPEQIQAWITQYETDLAANADDANAYHGLAYCWHFVREFRKVLDCYNKLIELEPDRPDPWRARAVLLATCPDVTLRDPGLALQDALTALQVIQERGGFGADWEARMYLEALVDAHAAAGDIDSAVEVQRSILPYAVTRVASQRVKEKLLQLEAASAAKQVGMGSEGTAT